MIEQIGAYTIERELGRGGMGVVYAGRAPSGEPVAIKLLLDAGTDVELRLRFETEIAACAKVRHPGVVRMLDAGREGGRPFLVMELLDGVSLDERLRRGDPLPVGEAVQLGARLAEALETVHRSGILHRDLKPSNVMLTSRGPVITDFGLARDPAAERKRITVSGEMLGTPAYMAPEQARGERHALGPATDVYGLGALIYQCLTGRTPFRGTQMQVLLQVLEAEPERPSLLREEVDVELEAIVLRCLAKRSEDRFASAGQLATALEDYALTLGEAPVRPRAWGPIAGAVAAGALVLGGVVFAIAEQAPATGSSTPVLAPTAASTPAPATAIALASEGQGALARARARDDSAERRAEFEAATASFRRALELDPRCREAWAGRLEALGAQAELLGVAPKQPELLEAVAALRARGPRDARLLSEASRLLRRVYGTSSELGLLEPAIELATEAIELDDRLGPAYRVRGMVRWELGRRRGIQVEALPPGVEEQVLGDLRRACDLEQSAEVQHEAAKVLAVLRRFQEAEAALTRGLALIEAGPSRRELRLTRSRVRTSLGMPALALEDLRASGALERSDLVQTRKRLERRTRVLREVRPLLEEERSWDAALESLQGPEAGAAAGLLRAQVYADRFTYRRDPKDKARALEEFASVLTRVRDHREAHVHRALIEPSFAGEAERHVAGGSTAQQALVQVALGQRALKRKRVLRRHVQEADRRLAEAVRLDPDCVVAWASQLEVVGFLFEGHGRALEEVARRIDRVQRTVEQRPKLRRSPILLAWLGVARHRQARGRSNPTLLPVADRFLSAALTLEHRYVLAWRVRGQVRRDQGRAAEAVTDLTEAARLHAEAPGVWLDLGQAFMGVREYEKAEQSLSESIRRWPKASASYALRGAARMALGRREEAQQDLAKAEALKPRR